MRWTEEEAKQHGFVKDANGDWVKPETKKQKEVAKSELKERAERFNSTMKFDNCEVVTPPVDMSEIKDILSRSQITFSDCVDLFGAFGYQLKIEKT
jgi:uncharacterized protein YktB (UPF0637 family)